MLKSDELLNFWDQLAQVHSLVFSVISHHPSNPTAQIGKAEVLVKKVSEHVVIFQEKGHWLIDDVPSRAFSNSFRFSLDLKTSLVSVEHLRYGENHPVFLFHLALSGAKRLESVEAHVCGQDTYVGNFSWDEKGLKFQWRVIGPKKNDQLTYYYT